MCGTEGSSRKNPENSIHSILKTRWRICSQNRGLISALFPVCHIHMKGAMRLYGPELRYIFPLFPICSHLQERHIYLNVYSTWSILWLLPHPHEMYNTYYVIHGPKLSIYSYCSLSVRSTGKVQYIYNTWSKTESVYSYCSLSVRSTGKVQYICNKWSRTEVFIPTAPYLSDPHERCNLSTLHAWTEVYSPSVHYLSHLHERLT